MDKQKNGLFSDFLNAFKGFMVGGADVIPGAGGTLALILGIYHRLVAGVSKIDVTMLKLLLKGQFRQAFEYSDFRFLVIVGTGFAVGLISLARLMHYLMLDHRQFTFAAFFGIIFAGSLIVIRIVPRWGIREVLLVAAGFVVSFWMVGLPTFKNPPDGPIYLFLTGMVAISAMILPGISGALVLLLLGKYELIIGILKGLSEGRINAEILTTLAIFCAGCAVGIVGFSKLLKMLLDRYEVVTMSFLGGCMFGSLRKLWPFQKDTTPEVADLEAKVFENIPLAQVPLVEQALPALIVAIVAAAAVLALEYWANSLAEPESPETQEVQAP